MSYSLNNKLGERRMFSDDWIQLDTARRWDVTVRRSAVRSLTPIEWKLLFFLFKYASFPVSASKLANALHGYVDECSKDTVKWHMCRLRKTLTYQGDPPPIETVRGFGYKYNPYFERS